MLPFVLIDHGTEFVKPFGSLPYEVRAAPPMLSYMFF
jgi:hypothetical protein